MSYRDRMKAQELQKEEMEVKKAIAKKMELEGKDNVLDAAAATRGVTSTAPVERKRRRWDETAVDATPIVNSAVGVEEGVPNDQRVAPSRWDETPQIAPVRAKSSRWDETPAAPSTVTGSSWDVKATPSAVDATPGGTKKRSRYVCEKSIEPIE